MDECMRFLINVDECLNMSAYDIFFYKLKNSRRFCCYPVQLRTGSKAGFLPALRSIHDHLRKYPYRFSNFQLNIVMYTAKEQQSPTWENTLLYSLLKLRHGLKESGLCMDGDFLVRRALNLFVIKGGDSQGSAAGPIAYLTDGGLKRDAKLLLEHVDMGSHHSPEASDPVKALQGFRNGGHCDPCVGDFLERFMASPASAVPTADALWAAFTDFLEKEFVNYQVAELPLPGERQDFPRENTAALLRIVDFINRPPDPVAPDLPLIESCRQKWQELPDDQQLEEKYSDMLFVYEKALEAAYHRLETEPEPVIRDADKLPEDLYAKPDAPEQGQSFFDNEEESLSCMTAALDAFMQQKLTVHTTAGLWHSAYRQLQKDMALESKLKLYTDGLSRGYSQGLEERKKEALHRKNRLFFADKDTENRIADLECRQAEYLKRLLEPDMPPPMGFQDQEKVDQALMLAKAEIDHYNDCLHAVNKRNFFGALTVVLGGTVLHYSVMQPFVFQNTPSLTTYLLFLHITAGGLALSRLVSRNYYRKSILNCATRLKTELEKYGRSCCKQAKLYREYINTLEQLDRTGKLLKAGHDALRNTQALQRGRLWHMGQITDHLTQLRAFRGLIDCGSDRCRSMTFDPDQASTAELVDDHGTIKSIEQCSLYWPQGKGDAV